MTKRGKVNKLIPMNRFGKHLKRSKIKPDMLSAGKALICKSKTPIIVADACPPNQSARYPSRAVARQGSRVRIGRRLTGIQPQGQPGKQSDSQTGEQAVFQLYDA